jgi:dihydroorotate dehydrogenase
MVDLFPIARPALFAVDPETAHKLTLFGLKTGLAGSDPSTDDAALGVSAMGLNFANPVGLAAGFDKNAEVPRAMLRLGMGSAEVGTVTPLPQPGNPKPRIFRLTKDHAVINRLGFNNQGLGVAKARLQNLPRRGGIIGANIGANKDASDRMSDYEVGLRVLYPYADYFTANISSPNTPGLRDLQTRDALEELLGRLVVVRDDLVKDGAQQKPLVLKIAPDLTPKDVSDIAEVVLASGIEGMIVSNTTIARPTGLKGPHADEAGGLSGKPLFGPSTEVLREVRRLTRGKIALIGAGGVHDGASAYAKIRAGASLVQLYTALIYQGPALIGRIKTELLAHLRADGYSSIADAVGVDAQ